MLRFVLPDRLVARLLAAALVFAAMLQALAPPAPGPVPLESARGSAFSASTADVALAPPRTAQAVRLAPLPPPPPLPAAPRPILAPAQAVVRPAIAPRPHSTGPPALQPGTRRPDPRGPPPA